MHRIARMGIGNDMSGCGWAGMDNLGLDVCVPHNDEVFACDRSSLDKRGRWARECPQWLPGPE